jgi:hypothetical protein
LTVADYRELTAREGVTETESLEDSFHRNAASWGIMLRDVEPARVEQMTQWTRGKLATYMGQVQLKAMRKVFEAQQAANEAQVADAVGANPTRRDRRAQASGERRSLGRRRN